MFWWGPSPKEEVRHHGQYYPACQLRCRPILTWMMQGLDAEVKPIISHPSLQLRVLYEDDQLAVIEKPSGLLSVLRQRATPPPSSPYSPTAGKARRAPTPSTAWTASPAA